MTKFEKVGVVGIVLGVILFIAFIVSWPLLMIFAANTLFPMLSIPYSFLTWLSVCILNISTFSGIHAGLNRIANKL